MDYGLINSGSFFFFGFCRWSERMSGLKEITAITAADFLQVSSFDSLLLLL